MSPPISQWPDKSSKEDPIEILIIVISVLIGLILMVLLIYSLIKCYSRIIFILRRRKTSLVVKYLNRSEYGDEEPFESSNSMDMSYDYNPVPRVHKQISTVSSSIDVYEHITAARELCVNEHHNRFRDSFSQMS